MMRSTAAPRVSWHICVIILIVVRSRRDLVYVYLKRRDVGAACYHREEASKLTTHTTHTHTMERQVLNGIMPVHDVLVQPLLLVFWAKHMSVNNESISLFRQPLILSISKHLPTNDWRWDNYWTADSHCCGWLYITTFPGPIPYCRWNRTHHLALYRERTVGRSNDLQQSSTQRSGIVIVAIYAVVL